MTDEERIEKARVWAKASGIMTALILAIMGLNTGAIAYAAYSDTKTDVLQDSLIQAMTSALATRDSLIENQNAMMVIKDSIVANLERQLALMEAMVNR